jgi:glycosyltransferase involved in cell wall biosynthesis
LTRRPRALALLPDGWGSEGGIAQFNRNLLAALAERGDLEIDAVGLTGASGAAVPAGVRWVVPGPGSRVAFARTAARLALVRRPEVVLSGLVGFGPLALPLSLGGRRRLWTLTHGVEIWQPGPLLDRLALGRSRLVTTVSRFSRERLLAWSGLAPERVEVLHNTVDLDRWSAGPRPDDLVRRYGVADRRVLLTVARLASAERYKGHDRVLAALGDVERRAGPLRYIVAGRGDDQPRLERLARDLGVRDLVTFAGFVPDSELVAHYRLADAFVMPSTGEGFGIVFLEAMACGCPVVAGNRDGSVDALADGELGRLVDPDRPQELADAIVATLLAGRGHDRAVAGVERFAFPRFRRRVWELADRLLGRAAPAPDGAPAR